MNLESVFCGGLSIFDLCKLMSKCVSFVVLYDELCVSVMMLLLAKTK